MRLLNSKHAVLVLLIVSTLAWSCKKDDNKPDRLDLLVEKNWRLTALTIDPSIDWFGNGTLVTNIYAQLNNCDRDDLYIFERNGVYKLDEGPTKCSPNDPQTITGTWTFNPDKTVITVNITGGSNSYTIKELESKRMVLEYQERFGGVTYTLTGTYTN